MIQAPRDVVPGGSQFCGMVGGPDAGHSCATDARQAVAEFHAAVHQSDMEWVLFFCSSEYDLDALAAEMRGLFDGVQVVVSALYSETAPC